MKGSSKIVEEILEILKDHSLVEEFERESQFTRTLYKNMQTPLTIVKYGSRVCVLLIKIEVNIKIEFFVDFEILTNSTWKLLSVTFGDKIYEYPIHQNDKSSYGLSSRMDTFLSIWAGKLRDSST